MARISALIIGSGIAGPAAALAQGLLILRRAPPSDDLRRHEPPLPARAGSSRGFIPFTHTRQAGWMTFKTVADTAGTRKAFAQVNTHARKG